jgi:hypothetical protein
MAVDRLASSADLPFEGSFDGGKTGRSLSVGDVDGDGNDDLLVGAPGAYGSTASSPEGQAYLFYGPLSSAPANEADADWTYTGDMADAQAGRTVLASGDYNADGYDDPVVAEPYWVGHNGIAGGGFCGLHGPVEGTDSSASYEAGCIPWDLDEDVWNWPGEYQVGWALASFDLDDDGVEDLVYGAPGYDGGAGLIKGMNDCGSVLRWCSLALFTAAGSDDQLGYALAVGVIDGDESLLVGAPGFDGPSTNDGIVYALTPGSSYAYAYVSAIADVAAWTIVGDTSVMGTGFGTSMASGFDMVDGTPEDSTDDEHALAACDATGECILFYEPATAGTVSPSPETVEIEWGVSTPLVVAAGGDMDGNGVGELLVGLAPTDGSSAGSVYVFPGSDTYDTLATTDAAYVYGGELVDDAFGAAMVAGDFNQDGKPDIVVGAPGWTYSATVDDGGGAFVFHGPYDPLEGTISLADADAAVFGDDTGDRTGFTVSGIGDVNCDGAPDLAIGGIFADEATTQTGAVYIFHGPTRGSTNLAWLGSTFVASDADVVFYGSAAGDGTGNNIAGLGDLDEDGCDDFAIAAATNSGAGAGAGAVYLFYGSDALGADLDPADADATIRGVTAGDNFGTGLRGGGDFTGDGIPDFIVGAPGRDTGGADAGAIYLFAGSGAYAGTVSASTAACTFTGVQAGSWAGWAGAVGFDFDGDGYGDLAVGAPGWDQGVSANTGRIYLVRGPTCSGSVALSSATMTVTGYQPGSQFGFAVAADTSAGPYDDLLVGAPFLGPFAPNTPYAAWIPGRASPSGALTAPAGGVVLRSTTNDKFGWSVAMADLDGDGSKGEAIVGAPVDNGAATAAGAVYAWYDGTLGGWEGDGLGHSTTTAEVTIQGDAATLYAGWCVDAPGDLNWDGEADIGIGAWGWTSGQGAAYVVLSSN